MTKSRATLARSTLLLAVLLLLGPSYIDPAQGPASSAVCTFVWPLRVAAEDQLRAPAARSRGSLKFLQCTATSNWHCRPLALQAASWHGIHGRECACSRSRASLRRTGLGVARARGVGVTLGQVPPPRVYEPRECAPDQPRPQVGTTFWNKWTNTQEQGSWDGNKPPWGCLWMRIWERYWGADS